MLEEIAPSDLDRYEARLRAMTRMLVRRHRERIERVADALLTNTLSAEQLDKLVGGSVVDVEAACSRPRLIKQAQKALPPSGSKRPNGPGSRSPRW
jgi:hypothetical protein